MRPTKIICTLGPATASLEKIRKLIRQKDASAPCRNVPSVPRFPPVFLQRNSRRELNRPDQFRAFREIALKFSGETGRAVARLLRGEQQPQGQRDA